MEKIIIWKNQCKDIKFFTLILLFFLCGCSIYPSKNAKLVKCLDNKAILIRGNIIKVPNGEYRYDYYDPLEKDSHYKYLESLKYQGGGESWEGIIYGAIKLSDPSLLDNIRFDPESDGIAIWSDSYDSLQKIGRLVAVIKTDNKVLTECIKVAESNFQME